jgi:hypothetical protein
MAEKKPHAAYTAAKNDSKVTNKREREAMEQVVQDARQRAAEERALAMMRQGEKAPRSPQQYIAPPVQQQAPMQSSMSAPMPLPASEGNSMVAPNNFNKSLGESSPQKKAKGGTVKYARGGGIEQRGKTRGKIV